MNFWLFRYFKDTDFRETQKSKQEIETKIETKNMKSAIGGLCVKLPLLQEA